MRDGDTSGQVGDWGDERGDHEDRQDRYDDGSEDRGVCDPAEGGYADRAEASLATVSALKVGLVLADSPHSTLQ